jgi:hypothetical protein
MPRATLVVLALLACGLLGCAATPAPSPTASPPGPAPSAVARIERFGGMPPPEEQFLRYPTVVLYDDGRLISQGPVDAIFPGSALPNLVVTHVSKEGIGQLLAWAADAGLVGANRELGQPIPDDDALRLVLVRPSGTHVTTIFRGGGDDAAIGAALQFQDVLLNVGEWLDPSLVSPTARYEWSHLRIISQAEGPMEPGAGDGPDVRDWPLAPLAGLGQPIFPGAPMRCAVIEGPDLEALQPGLETATDLTRWASDGQLYLLALHPLLPDEAGCPTE